MGEMLNLGAALGELGLEPGVLPLLASKTNESPSKWPVIPWKWAKKISESDRLIKGQLDKGRVMTKITV